MAQQRVFMPLMHQFDPCFYVTASFLPLFLNFTTGSTVGFARRSGRAWRRKGDCPLSCILFIPPKSSLCLAALCIMPKSCIAGTQSCSGIECMLRASSAHTGAETAQIRTNTPSVVSLLYLSRKSAEMARICRHPNSVYRHPARELPSPEILPSPAPISAVKGLRNFGCR